MILMAALSQGAKSHAQDLPENPENPVGEFHLSMSSLLLYKQERLYWSSFPGTEKYQVWYSSKPVGEYRMIQELNGYQSEYFVEVDCDSTVYFYILAKDAQGAPIARSNTASRATYPCVMAPEVFVFRHKDHAILSWERDLNVSWYHVVKVEDGGTLTTLRTMERMTSVKISIPCNETWKIWVIPTVYGKWADLEAVQVPATACSMMYIPLVQYQTGQ